MFFQSQSSKADVSLNSKAVIPCSLMIHYIDRQAKQWSSHGTGHTIKQAGKQLRTCHWDEIAIKDVGPTFIKLTFSQSVSILSNFGHLHFISAS